jgi:hypothetical protein
MKNKGNIKDITTIITDGQKVTIRRKKKIIYLLVLGVIGNNC